MLRKLIAALDPVSDEQIMKDFRTFVSRGSRCARCKRFICAGEPMAWVAHHASFGWHKDSYNELIEASRLSSGGFQRSGWCFGCVRESRGYKDGNRAETKPNRE